MNESVKFERISVRKADNLADARLHGGAMQEPGGSSTSAPQMPHRLLVPYASEWATVDENEMKCVNLESFSFRKADNLANGGATKEPGGSSTSMPQLPHRPPVQDALNSVTAGGNPLKFTHFPSQIAHFRRVGDRRTVRRPAARTWKARPAPLVARPTHPGVQKGEMPEMTSKWPGKASGGCAGTWAGVGGAKKKHLWRNSGSGVFVSPPLPPPCGRIFTHRTKDLKML